eukprot:Phypoly_transcript_01866.p1 GENE.Phypoly_transcript_01866~~Phypoly_transcript_01866.p1  ORF type:complete len:1019 (+),score=214.39 Phypoly_transcript_01866:45-3101(+)
MDGRRPYFDLPTPSPVAERDNYRSSFRPSLGYGQTPSQDSSFRHTPRKIDYSMDRDIDMNTTSRSDFSAQEVDDAVASEFPGISALLRDPSSRTSAGSASSFDRFAIDPMETPPLTTSDLDATLNNNNYYNSNNNNNTRKPFFSPQSAQPSPYIRPSKPIFSQDYDTSYDTNTTNTPQPAPFSQYAPSFSPNVQQSLKPSTNTTSTQSQIFPLSQHAVSQQSNKLGFSLMSEQSEEKPEENDFYGELWEFYKSFKKRVPPLGTVVDLSKIFAELCDTRAEQMFQSLPTYSSMLPTREQLKEKTAINLMAERNTWMLFFHLNVERDAKVPSATYSPSQVQVLETAMLSDALLKKNMIVLHWLESLHSHVFGEQESSRWPNTLNHLQNARDQRYVQSMDPDAPFRESKSLHEDDMKEEEMFLEALWGFYRGGKAASAPEFCLSSGQAWRAASIMGGSLYSSELETGNPNRTTWKNACCDLARHGASNPYEKAVYGILGQDIECVLPVCKTWEDYLWANLKVWSDAYIDDLLTNYPHPFLDEDEKRKYPYSVSSSKSIKDIMSELTHNPRIESTIQGLLDRYHEVQQYIILGDHQALLEKLAAWTQEAPLAKKVTQNPEFTRFAAHLVIAFRFRAAASGAAGANSQFGSVWVADPRSDTVIEAYVQYLINAKKHDLVALYSSFLPPNTQIDIYARFLSQKSIRDKADKQHLLDKAEEAGLDTKSIILRVAELNIKQPDQAPAQAGALALFKEPVATMELTESDKRKLKAIEWLCFDDAQVVDALVQSNVVVHEFLEAGKMEAVTKLISGHGSILPSNIVTLVLARLNQQQSKDIDVAIREHLAYKSLLEAHDRFNAWNAHHITPPEQPPRPVGLKRTAAAADIAWQVQRKKYEEEIGVWRVADEKLAEAARVEIMAVLYFEHGWLCNLEATGRQYHNIRRKYIPEAFFMLHRVLHETGSYKACVGIARKVASEKGKLYTTFTQAEIQKLLVLIEQSAKALLSAGFTDPTGYRTNEPIAMEG